MRKVINGKLYDTDSAKCVGEWDNGYLPNDFHYTEERLFLKKTGEFFLYGSGGAISKYTQATGSGYRGSEQIFPLSEEKAKEWAEKSLSGDAYLEIFELPEEEVARLTLYLPMSLKERLSALSAAKKISMSEYVVNVLSNELATNEQEET